MGEEWTEVERYAKEIHMTDAKTIELLVEILRTMNDAVNYNGKQAPRSVVDNLLSQITDDADQAGTDKIPSRDERSKLCRDCGMMVPMTGHDCPKRVESICGCGDHTTDTCAKGHPRCRNCAMGGFPCKTCEAAPESGRDVIHVYETPGAVEQPQPTSIPAPPSPDATEMMAAELLDVFNEGHPHPVSWLEFEDDGDGRKGLIRQARFIQARIDAAKGSQAVADAEIIGTMKASHAAKIDEAVKAETQRAKDAYAKRRAEAQQVADTIEARHDSELSTLRSQHAAALSKLREELQAARELHSHDILKMNKSHAAEVAAARARGQRDVLAHLSTELADDIDAVLSNLIASAPKSQSAEVAALREELHRAIVDAKSGVTKVDYDIVVGSYKRKLSAERRESLVEACKAVCAMCCSQDQPPPLHKYWECAEDHPEFHFYAPLHINCLPIRRLIRDIPRQSQSDIDNDCS